MTLEQSSFFSCRGYALAALGVLAWAARAMEEGGPDAAHARAWVGGRETVRGDALSFVQCVQACGLSSRREELRQAFTHAPGQALARLLIIDEAVRGETGDLEALAEEDDPVEEQLRAMRGFHFELAGHTVRPAAGEVAC